MPESDRPRSAHRRRRLSRKGKVVAALATVTVVAGAALGYFTLFPKQAPAFVQKTLVSVGLADPNEVEPQAVCPLTGEVVPSGRVPTRPALAVKVENHPEARPQSGLNSADIVYEEPVEGGITRFIAVYHCGNEARVGPVRSARMADPHVLSQFGVPIFAFSGGAPHVERKVSSSELVPLDETAGGSAFVRDPGRAAPHDLYTGTRPLYRLAKAGRVPPSPVFGYTAEVENPSRRSGGIHLRFSSTYADVFWTWSRRDRAWVRAHGSELHLAEDGEAVSADNVIVQVIATASDPSGGPTPILSLTGTGRAYVFRDGRVILGRWERDSLRDVTRFVTKSGDEIMLAPGRTWVELTPNSVVPEVMPPAG
ncbi:MAG TPA: DUF3048 domain-containing protein [Actinomycetota bacterium]|nr:DUF3048 domain-containing protein [Actinomycetota bacterium]